MLKLFLPVLIIIISSSSRIESARNNNQFHEVRAILELDVVELKANSLYSDGLAVRIKFQNNTDRKIFIANIYPIYPKIFLVDPITDSLEEIDVQRLSHRQMEVIPDTIRALIGVKLGILNSYSFTDSLARMHTKAIMSNKDTLQQKNSEKYNKVARHLKFRYRQILYLSPQQTHEELFNITTFLNRTGKRKGRYKIVYYNQIGFQPNPDETHFPFPNELNGFRQWKGKVVSDTLYLNIR